MKIYVAALYSMRETEAAEAARVVLENGHECTARWIGGGEVGKSQAGAAVMDIEDIDAAEALIMLALPYGTMFKGGGRHFEMGYAHGRGKRIAVVGDHESVFCHLPSVMVCPTVGAAIHFLEDQS